MITAHFHGGSRDGGTEPITDTYPPSAIYVPSLVPLIEVRLDYFAPPDIATINDNVETYRLTVYKPFQMEAHYEAEKRH